MIIESKPSTKNKMEIHTLNKAFLATIRTLIPILKTEAHKQIKETENLQALLEKRAIITKAPETLFDGTSLNDSDTLCTRFVDETIFTYLLCIVFCESLIQTYQISCTIQMLERCIPEVQAYTWFIPSRETHRQITQTLSSTPLHPIPIHLASQIYEEALTKNEKKLLGQYYTPPILANHLLDQVGYCIANQLRSKRIFDVATGFGIFLTEAVKRLIKDDLLAQHDIITILSHISTNLYGYDVNPFAVVATKMQILCATCTELPLASDKIELVLSQFHLPHICVADTLAQPFSVDEHLSPHIVIGNPPYGTCSSGKHLHRFQKIIDGRANLYELFLYFALERCIPQGRVAFLIPESLRSGRYFTALRKHLKTTTRFIATTDFHARTSIFTDVEQGVGIFVCEKNTSSDPADKVMVVQSADENTLLKAQPFSVPLSHIQLEAPMDYMLIKAASSQEYALIAKLCQLRDSPQNIAIKAHTGRFVWNQHHDAFIEPKVKDVIPVIYAHTVHRYSFTFPPDKNNKNRNNLLFAHPSSSAQRYTSTGEALLIQRTTAREQDWRLIATLIPSEFRQAYPTYLIENHVNFIQEAVSNNIAISLFYLLGILNSKLINYLFSSLSGTTHVSSWELQHLPILYVPDTRLETLVKQRLSASIEEATILEKQIHDEVYKIYRLNDQEQHLIEQFYQQKHSRHGHRLSRSFL